ncbi:HEAT repeat protein [Symmachiella dynata]|uniref:HEAT repeat domain-containing protein n=1 Tax=Symmachiella dynata TaxID=2527995 RepID=UPI00118A17F7|nr:HEAT repeat domain-containing protein [Symmachiella dynata]QDT46544.1 HEAT repeat protein [Symmachiella dynata]
MNHKQSLEFVGPPTALLLTASITFLCLGTGLRAENDAAYSRAAKLYERIDAAITPADYQALASDCVRRLRLTPGNTNEPAAQVLLRIVAEKPDVLKPYVPTLLEYVGDADRSSTMRCYELQVVGLAGGNADQILPVLEKALGNSSLSDFFARFYAAQAILRIDSQHTGAISFLINQVDAKEPTSRWTSAYIMRGLPKLSDRLTPILEKKLDDPHPSVRVYAAGALIRNQQNKRLLEKIVQTLSNAVKEDGRSAYLMPITFSEWTMPHNMIAVGYLKEIGPSAGSAVPVLLQALQSSEVELRVVIPQAISAIGSGSDEEIIALTRVTQQDKSAYVRREAQKALQVLYENKNE